jgi:aspartate racemase
MLPEGAVKPWQARPVRRTLGLIGGMSWESSALYYRLLNTGVRERLGGLHSARCLLASVDFADVERMQAENRWDEAAILLATTARDLERAGAGALLLCTNTMHKVADEIEEAVGIPLLHLADATADAVLAAGITTAGLLGTAITMEQAFYRDRLAARGLEVLVPGATDRALVNRVIFDELCRGVVTEASRAAYRTVIDRLGDAGAAGIILGCTEIELLISSDDSPVPVFPTTSLHVTAGVDWLLAG